MVSNEQTVAGDELCCWRVAIRAQRRREFMRCSFRQELHAFGANDHRQVPVLPLLMRCKCAESTNQYWDKTCLQLSSIQGTDLDVAEVFVENSMELSG